MTWKALLENLARAREELTGQALSLMDDLPDALKEKVSGAEPNPFILDSEPHGNCLSAVRFDIRRHFRLKDRTCCLYSLKPLQHGLLYYDTIVVPLLPVDSQHFELAHNFSVRDLDELERLRKERRVIVVLLGQPSNYLRYDYLQPIVERLEVQHMPWSPIVQRKRSESDSKYEVMAEEFVEIPPIKGAIAQLANQFGEDPANVEFGLLETLLLLNDWECTELKDFLWKLLIEDPTLALVVVFALRRLLIIPLHHSPQIPVCMRYDEVQRDYWAVGRALNLKNVAFPGELGALFEAELSYPSPSSWDSLKWCEDHLDVKRIREGFNLMQAEVCGIVEKAPDRLVELRQIINDEWIRNKKTVARARDLIYWGGSLGIGVIGTAVTGPVVGLLAALGFTCLSNTLVGPMSDQLVRLMMKKPFHIWKLSQNLGRNKP